MKAEMAVMKSLMTGLSEDRGRTLIDDSLRRAMKHELVTGTIERGSYDTWETYPPMRDAKPGEHVLAALELGDAEPIFVIILVTEPVSNVLTVSGVIESRHPQREIHAEMKNLASLERVSLEIRAGDCEELVGTFLKTRRLR